MHENDIDQNFEHFPVEDLSKVLKNVYGSVLSKTQKEYSKSGMINLHSGINRHLRSPPYKRNFDIMNDRPFTQANPVFSGRLHDNKNKGLNTSMPRPSLLQQDIEKLFNEYFIRTVGDKLDTQILLHKVFFDIMYYTGR